MHSKIFERNKNNRIDCFKWQEKTMRGIPLSFSKLVASSHKNKKQLK